MITAEQIWSILDRRMPRGRWVSLAEIYQFVSQYGVLDREDYQPQAPGSKIPKWKRNVRNVLQRQKNHGRVDWDGDANYWMAGR